jgi:hypothetical protein
MISWAIDNPRVSMSRRQKTLQAVFADPIRANISWKDIESVFRGYGAIIEEREGSRVAVMLNDLVAVFHRPHPRKEASKKTIGSVRRFLIHAGVTPP